MSNITKQFFNFADIKASAKTQARAELNKEALTDYTIKAKEAKGKGADFPFDGGTVFKDESGNIWLADGFHRRKAGQASDYEGAEYIVKEGTENDAFLFACKANLTHGARLTNADKLHNLNRAFDVIVGIETKPNTEVAELVGVSEKFVRDHRPVAKSAAVKIVKRGGKAVKVNTSRIGKKGGKAAKPAKAPKGKGSKAPATPAAPTSVGDACPKELTRISSVLGGEIGPKTKKAITDGVLPLSAKQVRDWAGFPDGLLKKAEPLITGPTRWEPNKALAFINQTVDEKTRVADLLLHASIEAKCSAKFIVGDFQILVTSAK